MNLLLLDDEEYIVLELKKIINTAVLDIDEIYTAFTVEQAKQIMEIISIDIIVSDIVLPGSNGFDFVRWVRRQKYEVQVIFLTSYAEFDYAKAAISLESIEYMLKPIDHHLFCETLKKAIQYSRKSKKEECKNALYYLKKDFWREVFNGFVNESNVEEECKERGLFYRKNDKFQLIYLEFKEETERQKKWDTKILGFIVENVLSEKINGKRAHIEAVIAEKEYSHIVIVKNEDEDLSIEDSSDMDEILQEFLSWLQTEIKINIWCGVGDEEKIEGIAKSRDILISMREDNLSIWNKISYLSDYVRRNAFYHNPNFNTWKKLLEERKECELITSIENHLDILAKDEHLTRGILKIVRVDITQIVYTWLFERNIKANLLYENKDGELLYKKAVNGISEAKEYISYLITQAVRYEQTVHKEGTIAWKIRRYLDGNYKRELRRDELSKQFFLNGDYINKIFKTEFSISISAYLLQCRVDEAKRLLAASDMPINAVSLHVGYSSFSYFTKMFKEKTGYSPLEYRRKCQIEK